MNASKKPQTTPATGCIGLATTRITIGKSRSL